MIKTVALSLAGTLLAVASPAFADVARTAAEPSNVELTSAVLVQAPKASPVKATRYCVTDTVTGSRIARKSCQTREQWIVQGFDPLAKN